MAENLITFTLSDEDYEQLFAYAAHEDRTPDAQAKILVRKGLSTYVEYKPIRGSGVVKSKPVSKGIQKPGVLPAMGEAQRGSPVLERGA